jgi:hypothetical protein
MLENDLFDDLVDDVPADQGDQGDQTTNEPVSTDDNVDQNDDDYGKNLLPSDDDNDDVLTSYLKSRGIKDGRTVIYEHEDGNTEETDFNSLSKDEQLNILTELSKSGLTPDEIETIDYLRSQRATLKDVVDYYSQLAAKNAIEQYIAQNGETIPTYQVDDYSDEELYIADLRSKYDMTEEELIADLEMAKSNEELFSKKVEVIRNQYKAAEDQRIEDDRLAREAQMQNFTNGIYDALTNFNELSLDYRDLKSDSLQIEDSEKEAVYNYILSQDENGATQFFKDLNDPNVLVELAWYRLYGQDAISGISQY